jgi:hypothetical protein
MLNYLIHFDTDLFSISKDQVTRQKEKDSEWVEDFIALKR